MRCGDAYIVYCDKSMVLDKGPYATWREVQDAYPDYKTSLGPWTEVEIVDFLREDCGSDDSQWPFPANAITAFFRSDDRILRERVA